MRPNIPKVSIFWLEFKNTVVIVRIATSKCLPFFPNSKFSAKTKLLKFGKINALITMFHSKSKNFKLGNKNALFQYFLGWNLEKVLLYLKSAPSIFQNAKFSAKQRKHYNTWDPKCLIWVFLSLNQHSPVCEITKFQAKTLILTF